MRRAILIATLTLMCMVELSACSPSVTIIVTPTSLPVQRIDYSGNGDKLLGPFDLPPGNYKVTAHVTSGKNIFIVLATTLSGNCGMGPSLTIHGGATENSTVVSSNGCRVTMETSAFVPDDKWSISIEPIQ